MKDRINPGSCCGAEKPTSDMLSRRGNKIPSTEQAVHPDHSAQLNRLNRVMGQLQGVKRMIEERRYCPEILTQVRAANAALRGVGTLMLGTHLRHCVAQALPAQDSDLAEVKIEELVSLVAFHATRLS